jgi:hypothetical protein
MFFGINNINKILNFEFKNWKEVFTHFNDPFALILQLNDSLPLFDTQDQVYNYYIDNRAEIVCVLKKLDWGKIAEIIGRKEILQKNHRPIQESTSLVVDFDIFDKISYLLHENINGPKNHSGIIYTPYYLAEQIAQMTINQWYNKNQSSNFKTVKKPVIRLLDPTVGTGTFLIAAGNIIFDILKKEDPLSSSFSIRRRIIEQYLHGFDKDPIGIFITRNKLKLWILDDIISEIELYEGLTDNIRQKDSLFNYSNSLVSQELNSSLIEFPKNIPKSTPNDNLSIYKLPSKPSLLERIVDINDYHKNLFQFTNEHYFVIQSSRREWNQHKDSLVDSIRKNVHFSIPDYFNPSYDTYLVFPNGDRQINKKIIKNLKRWNFSESFQNNELELNPKFDIIIGNPPFIALTDLSMITRLKIKEFFPDIYNGNSDISYFFVKRVLQILSSSGVLGFLLPKSLLSGVHAEKIRQKIVRETTIIEIHDFNDLLLFPQVKIKTCCIVLENQVRDSNSVFNAYTYFKPSFEKIKVAKIYQNDLKVDKWTLLPRKINEIIEKMEYISNYRLREISSISKGIETGCDNIFAPKTPHFFSEKLQLSSSHYKSWLKGKEIKQYSIKREGREVLFAPKFRQKQIENSKTAFQYLKENRNELLDRSRVTKYFLWRDGDERSTMDWQGVKIVTPYKGSVNTFAIDNEGCLSSKDVVWIIPHEEFKNSDSLLFLLSLLNSKLLTFYAQSMFKDLGGMYDYYPHQIRKLPLLIPAHDSQEYLDIVNLANQIENSSLLEKEKLVGQINEILYRLYKLTREQISEIETRIRP